MEDYMKKLAAGMIAAAMMGVSAVPALAHTVELEQEAESGDVTQVFQSVVTGDDSNVSTFFSSVVNTGNVQSQSYIQYGSEDMTEPMMPEMPVEGELPAPDAPEDMEEAPEGEMPTDAPEGEMPPTDGPPPAPSGPPSM